MPPEVKSRPEALRGERGPVDGSFTVSVWSEKVVVLVCTGRAPQLVELHFRRPQPAVPSFPGQPDLESPLAKSFAGPLWGVHMARLECADHHRIRFGTRQGRARTVADHAPLDVCGRDLARHVRVHPYRSGATPGGVPRRPSMTTSASFGISVWRLSCPESGCGCWCPRSRTGRCWRSPVGLSTGRPTRTAPWCSSPCCRDQVGPCLAAL